MSSMLRVECLKSDCTYYHKTPEPDRCDCSHPEKKYFRYTEVCPLYRRDWSKSNGRADELRKRFGVGGKS